MHIYQVKNMLKWIRKIDRKDKMKKETTDVMNQENTNTLTWKNSNTKQR